MADSISLSNPASSSLLPSREQLADLVGQILDSAKQQGASASEAAVSFASGLAVTVRLGEVETLQHQRNRSLGVTVYFDHSKGSASTSDWTPQAIQDTVAAACAIARHTAADPCAGLADPERLAQTIPELDLYHPWDVDVNAAIDLAKQCEAAALDCDSRISNSDGASINRSERMHYYGNSHGFGGGYPSSRNSTSCSVIAKDDGGMQSNYWYSTARLASQLEPPPAIGKKAAERALQRLGAKRLSTRKAPVLFSAELARGFLGHFVSAISGGPLYRKASFLLDQQGQQVFPDFFSLREQPHLPQALASAPFDGEGVATQERDLVRTGVIQGYVLDSYAARRLGLETTGNAGGIHNLSVVSSNPSLSFNTLLKQMNTGLVVTQLMGQGINLVTGDYSRGAAGFWVENGEIQYPVEEITIAGHLRKLYADIVAVGDDIDRRGAILSGSLLIEEMTIAGA